MGKGVEGNNKFFRVIKKVVIILIVLGAVLLIIAQIAYYQSKELIGLLSGGYTLSPVCKTFSKITNCGSCFDKIEKNVCYATLAIDRVDINLCKKAGVVLSQCIQKVSEKIGVAPNCNFINDVKDKDHCNCELCADLNDFDFCLQVENISIKDYCYDRAVRITYNYTGCLFISENIIRERCIFGRGSGVVRALGDGKYDINFDVCNIFNITDRVRCLEGAAQNINHGGLYEQNPDICNIFNDTSPKDICLGIKKPTF